MTALIKATNATFEVRLNGFELLGCRNVGDLITSVEASNRLARDNSLTIELMKPRGKVAESAVRAVLEGYEVRSVAFPVSIEAEVVTRWDNQSAGDHRRATAARINGRDLVVHSPFLEVPFRVQSVASPQRWEAAERFIAARHETLVLNHVESIWRSLASRERAEISRFWSLAEEDLRRRSFDLRESPTSPTENVFRFMDSDDELDRFDRSSIVVHRDPSERVIWALDSNRRSPFRKRFDGIVQELLVYFTIDSGKPSVIG